MLFSFPAPKSTILSPYRPVQAFNTSPSSLKKSLPLLFGNTPLKKPSPRAQLPSASVSLVLRSLIKELYRSTSAYSDSIEKSIDNRFSIADANSLWASVTSTHCMNFFPASAATWSLPIPCTTSMSGPMTTGIRLPVFFSSAFARAFMWESKSRWFFLASCTVSILLQAYTHG